MKKTCRMILFVLLVALLAGCATVPGIQLVDASGVQSPASTPAPPMQDDILEAHFIDVGQGDSILLRINQDAWLIDAGPNSQGTRVVQYLQDQGIDSLTMAVGTHPHEDHIGGLDEVIRTFDIAHVMMPPISHTTKTFEDVVNAIETKKLNITAPTVGDTYELGPATVRVLGPGTPPYTDMNDASIALHISYGQVGILLTGDAEKAAEQRMLDSGYPVAAQVFKAGHHGSSTSNTDALLDAVSPQTVVISLAADNSYGHPHREVVQALQNRGIQSLRTDELGDIVMTTDGTQIHWSSTKGEASDAPMAQAQQFIGNLNSQVFHLPQCSSLPAEKNRVWFDARNQAIDAGYRACPRCNP